MNATVRDISRTGISFYCAQRIHEGVQLNLKVRNNLEFHGAKVVRVDVVETVPNNGKSFVIGASFTSAATDSRSNAVFLKWADSLPIRLHLVPPEEGRSADRKETNLILDVTIPSPKVVDKQFHILSNGVHCTVDQYIPVFHEIRVIADKTKSSESKDISGVVVRCEELEHNRYSLDVFFPTMPSLMPPYPNVRIAL